MTTAGCGTNRGMANSNCGAPWQGSGHALSVLLHQPDWSAAISVAAQDMVSARQCKMMFLS